jgi:hypothetical protein
MIVDDNGRQLRGGEVRVIEAAHEREVILGG